MTENNSEAPTGVLRAEHQVILRVIQVLKFLVNRSESGGGFEKESLGQCVEFFRLFADACHHAKEEGMLFPMLESRGIPREGGPIGVMLHEHELARGFTRDMGDALESVERGEGDGVNRFHGAARQYIELLTDHIHKEDQVLFNMGDQVMTAEDQSSLCRQFCEAGCDAMGGRTKEELERIAEDLETRWPDGRS